MKPLIVTEGKTDIIYLNEAIRSLHTDFPILGKVSKGKFSKKIRFLKEGEQLKTVLKVSGGCDSLKNIIPPTIITRSKSEVCHMMVKT